ncbi:HD domain-containing protein [Promethearchaeum syntrophicum]|uniref:HD domain-containing protein n=1 Tax=Promethearchaeum syntrophicum TaxID=2594042 RepID=A0A5B9D6P9_9ARCH|nr:HD domain-containing protein [Candidatus Prometheoarchaeum syntrophicum]QEE14774.1 deoxyguanosinetriphosphate triphosphohydrolase-like protein [Candidatus Prometheoarchaeum syntrophicum]
MKKIIRGSTIKINDPIHGFMVLPDFITEIVDSREIQRLMRIRQLSGASHVYPGANHTRFEHSLGVAYLAKRLSENLRDLQGVDISDDDINDCVVAALCHDIGHGPFSHNFESLLIKHNNKDHEDYTEWLIKKSEIGEKIEEFSFDKNYISDIATGKIIGKANEKGYLLSQMITSAVNVDSMDYLMRDNYHCGTEKATVDINRLLLSMDEIDGFLGVNIKALISLEGFLLSRISSFRTIYFHKTCRSVQMMLEEAMKSVVNEIGFLNYSTPEDFLKWDDYVLWTDLIRNPISAIWMEKIQKRELLKSCFESQIQISNENIDVSELREKISRKTGINAADIFIDLPSSPNVPYSHTDQTRPNEIYTFERLANGKKQPVHLEDHSIFFNNFKGSLKILRIYTWPKNRKKVADIASSLYDTILKY